MRRRESSVKWGGIACQKRNKENARGARNTIKHCISQPGLQMGVYGVTGFAQSASRSNGIVHFSPSVNRLDLSLDLSLII